MRWCSWRALDSHSDSEPNTSARLIRRLVARFAAITEQLAGVPRSQAPRLREGLRITFKLGDDPLSSDAMISSKTIDQLTPVYYNINDWIVSAFSILLGELKVVSASVLISIRTREDQLLATKIDHKAFDDVPLDDFDVASLSALGNESGKALFLEPWVSRTGESGVATCAWQGPRTRWRQYEGRLRDRHVVIARLAREGVAPLILTMNFDLLLEGACRAAGFEVGDVSETDPDKPSAAYDRVLVVAGPTDFFERGTAYRAALPLKIHGCVHRYREERERGTLARYLPSTVFTYREIQNWRKDSWSRDLVSTLLRTRAIVLCGYSGADPVMHDTFRTVYEEILAIGVRAPRRKTPPEKDTLAFFTGASGRAEFPGLEIFRASSRAAGVANRSCSIDPNHLGFHFPKRDSRQSFPSLDELFLWLYHRSLRRLQLNAIRSDLQRIAVMLLHRNVAPADVEDIGEMFQALCKVEQETASALGGCGQLTPAVSTAHRLDESLSRRVAARVCLDGDCRAQSAIRPAHPGVQGTVLLLLAARPARMGRMGRGGGARAAPDERAHCRRRPVAVSDGDCQAEADRLYANRGRPARPGAHVQRSRRRARGDRRVHEWELMSWMRPDVAAAGTPSAGDVGGGR